MVDMDERRNGKARVMDVRDIFDQDCPPEVQLSLLRLARSAANDGEAFCGSQFSEPEVRDTLAHVCRAYVETSLSRLPKQFPGLVGCHLGQTPSHNSYRFLRVGRLVITASFLGDDDGRVPRGAEFRNSFAKSINHPRLFPEDEADRLAQLDAIEQLYALLTYRRKSRTSAEVVQVSVVFVDRECRYIDHVDLLAREAALQAARPVEQVEDRVRTSRKSDEKKQAEGAG